VCAWIFIAIGAISAIQCFWCALNARSITEKILSGDFKKGGWWKKHHHHENAPTYALPDSIDRDEFAIYDTVRMVCGAGFFLGMLILCTGKKALCAVWKEKPEFNKRVMKMTIVRVVLMVLCCIFMHHHG